MGVAELDSIRWHERNPSINFPDHARRDIRPDYVAFTKTERGWEDQGPEGVVVEPSVLRVERSVLIALEH